MALGFVLISTENGREREVHREVQALPDVVEVTPLLGEFDFIAKIDAGGLDALGQSILDIRNVTGVAETQSLTAARL